MAIKKALLATTALALCTSIISACGNSSSNSQNTPEPTGNAVQNAQQEEGGKKFDNMELDIAVFQGGYGRDYWDAVADSFMQDYPGTKINITANPKIAEMIRPKIVAGNPPDFIYLAGDTSLTDGLIKDKAILDITDVINSKVPGEEVTVKDKLLTGVIETSAFTPYNDGKVYLAPYAYNVMGLWYNKDLFDKKGIAVPKTWDELFALNATAKENNRALFTTQALAPGYTEEIIVPALYDLGGQELVNRYYNHDPEVWNTDEAKQMAGLFKRIAEEDNALMKGTPALNHTQAQTEFMQGKALFITNGNWFESEMKDAPREEGFQFGFMGIPSFKQDGKPLAQASFEQMYIPAKAKNPELAKEFLKYLFTDKSIQLNGEKAKSVMPVKGAVDMVKPYISADTYNVFKAVEGGITPVTGAHAPFPQGAKFIRKDIFSPVISVLSKQMTVEEWLGKEIEIFTEFQTLSQKQ